MKQVTIGIVGGKGQMGRWFNRFFTGAGHRVVISDLKTELRPKDIAEKSDVVTGMIQFFRLLGFKNSPISPFFISSRFFLTALSDLLA